MYNHRKAIFDYQTRKKTFLDNEEVILDVKPVQPTLQQNSICKRKRTAVEWLSKTSTSILDWNLYDVQISFVIYINSYFILENMPVFARYVKM